MKGPHVTFTLLLLSLCAGLYAWTADFPLAFDDYTYLIDNPVFHNQDAFSYLWKFTEFATYPARIGSDPDYAVNFIMRPVAYASFYLNHWADGFNPRWYRIMNFIIHGCNGLLVYALTTVLLQRASRRFPLSSGSVLFIPITAALLFVAHPLAIESVTYVIQRFTSMMTLFSLLALWLHFLSLQSTSRASLWLLRAGSMASLILAMQTKECSVTIPFVAVLLDAVVLGSGLVPALRRSLPLLICAPLIPLLVILTSTAQNGWVFDWSTSLNIVNSRDEPLNHWHYIVTQFTVLVHYLRLLFWPTGLNLDPQWPLYDSLFRGPVIASLTLLAAGIAAAIFAFRRFRTDSRFAMILVFTFWFFITISISSGLVPLPDLVAEHRAYLPSIGIFVIVACLLDCLRTSASRTWARTWVPGAVGMSIFALAWSTCARNEVWRTTESLWANTVEGSPGKFRTWGNLGAAYSMSGKEEKAVECYRKALEIEPRFQNGLLNLSNSLLRLGRPEESVEMTLQLIKNDHTIRDKAPVAYTLALGLAGVGRLTEAAQNLEQMLAMDPKSADAHQLLGLVYAEMGKNVFALRHLQKAARLRALSPKLLERIRDLEQKVKTPLVRFQ